MANWKVYQAIAHAIANRKEMWAHDLLDIIEKEYLPQGCGVECKILKDECREDRIVMWVVYHHMNENGFNVGWTYHKVFVTPSLRFGFDLKITGRNKDNVKEYLGDWLAHNLEREVNPIEWARVAPATMEK